MNDIERQQEEMKQNILLAIKESDHVDVTITIEDPCALAAILENVWIRSVDFGELGCNDFSLNIDAYGKRYDIVNRNYDDDLENLV